ncbi:hypothetical protein [Williamsia phyllosphaerae]|uniref:Uncharacterized protein n=1 Tax=Williamsia phyllosphaerae TaxID=885042 RepID=A0ABQ1UTP9_9NOCA|nr:hypothetical protein [Williamsia phyllosphaerae]GGF26793.1 hypothetical protein GCM10007298_23440 [Williamsia phyllosphaerae]
MAKVTAATFTKVKPKKKCCRKSTRCAACPVVLHRLGKMDAHEFSNKQFTKALKKARAA